MKNIIVFGILILEIFTNVYSMPAEANDEGMQSDDYNYADDETADSGTSSQQGKTMKPANFKGSKAYFTSPNSTVTAIAGKDIRLHCDVSNLHDEVVLWYKDGNVVANDGNVLLPMYSVDNNTHMLTVIKASESSQGEYYCELQPGNKRLYTNVIISHEPLDVVVPESSPSMQTNAAASWTTASFLLLTLSCALQKTFLRL